MKHYIFVDSSSNILYLLETSSETIMSDAIEVSQEDYNLLNSNIGKYQYKYVDKKVVNNGNINVEIPLSSEEQKMLEILDGLNMLLELQADILGGAV